MIESLESFSYLVFILIGVVLSWFSIYKKRNPKVDYMNTPILLSYFSSLASLQPLKHDEKEGLNYSIFLALSDLNDNIANTNSAIYRVELPYYSQIHLLAITKNKGATQIKPSLSSTAMEPVTLEGDFNNYFSLYADKNMQTLSRYVMDPKAMLFSLEFCRSHSWEIVDNSLYFVDEFSTSSEGDTTSAFKDIVNFVDEIKPALAKKLTPNQLKILSPYGIDRRKDIKCPICSELLIIHRGYRACPALHGFLLTGNVLTELRKGKATITDIETVKSPERTGPLSCPSCASKMQLVDYNDSGTMIDSCPNCTYRWLDIGEIKKINTKVYN